MAGTYGYRGLDTGGSSGRPGPDSVGSDEIIDGSILLEDLNKEVKDKMVDHVSPEELDKFKV